MNDIERAQPRRRSAVARIGICLLNFNHPGLGLIRLSRYPAGFAFLALELVMLASTLIIYETDLQLTYEIFIGAGMVILVYALVTRGGSAILTWRWSAEVSPRRGWLWRWYGVLGLWALLAMLSWPFTNAFRSNYRNFYAPSASMAPTLQRGDRFMGKMLNIDPIARGDVVIVRNGAFDFVKRVVGIPGDTIAMRDGIIVLNGIPVPQRGLQRVNLKNVSDPRMAMQLREQFPGEGHSHDIYDLGPTPQDNTDQVRLGKSQYFMLGDNRDNSMDSRFAPAYGGMGIVDRSRIEGLILFRYWRNGVGLRGGQV